MEGKIDWGKFIANVGGTGVAGGGILAFVPAKYQVPAAIGLAVLSNLLAALQQSVIKKSE